MIGKRLKKLRETAQKSQQEVCSALNIEQSTLANYENDKRIPKIDILIHLADYYNASTDFLLGRTESRNPDTIYNSCESIMIDRLDKLLNEYSDLDYNFYSQISRIPVETIHQYANGEKQPSIFDLCKLIEVLDTSADYLFGNSDIAHPQKEPTRVSNDNTFAYKLDQELNGTYLETELADELNISISKIDKMLHAEEMPSPDILEKLSQLFKKSTDYMLGLAATSRNADVSGHYPFHMDTESIRRLQELLGNEWDKDAEYDVNDLRLTYDEYYMLYHYGFIPHISVLQKLCKQYNISADYLLNISDSKLCIKISKEIDEDDLLKEYRKLERPYRQKINGLLAEQLLQQERDNYMRSSSVAADGKYIDDQGKSSPSSGTGGGTIAV